MVSLPLGSLALLMVFGLTSSVAPPLNLTEKASGSRVALAKGQVLTVALKGNPTTGFKWEMASGAEGVLAQQGEAQYAPDSKLVGAGGVYTYTFQAVAGGAGVLKLVYRRPWEEEPPARVFEVRVDVAER